MKSGIYAIRCTNGKMYVGSAANLETRRQHHWNRLKANAHGNRHLQNAWNKHSPDAFIWGVIEFIAADQLITREQHFIDLFDTCNPRRGFNLSPTAGSCLGCKHSDEGKARKSAALKGKKKSPEHVEKSRLARLGKPGTPWTKERRVKNCAALKGRKRSPEACERMRAARRAKPRKPMTEEHKAKIIASLTGRKGSDKQRAAAAATNRDRVWTEEAKQRIGEANRNRVLSKETRAKMSLSGKEANRRRKAEAARLKAEQRAEATFLRTGIKPAPPENPKRETQGKLFD